MNRKPVITIKDRINEVINHDGSGHNIPRMGLNEYAELCRQAADSFYHDINTGERIYHNPGERFMLITSEISEAFEGLRKNKMDDHLPHRKSVEVELCDALIRIFDYAGENGLDLDGAFWEKLAYNKERQDHTHLARRQENGKKW
jgi:NTP pyrophosphatase (non-canonical NTP hydrolase)